MKRPDQVVASPLSFKAKLNIGEDAYSSLTATKNLQSAWNLIGVGSSATGVAKTAWVASIIGTKAGPLAFLGLGNPVTAPLAVAAIAIGSTAMYFGATRKWQKFSDDRVVTIPKFLNTPLDLLAANLLDFMARLSVKVASADGTITDEEKNAIEDYFIYEWGYDQAYLNCVLKEITRNIEHENIEDIVLPLRDLISQSKDCNADAISDDLLSFLEEVISSDNQITPAEQSCLSEIAELLEKKNQLAQVLNRIKLRLKK